jgi:CMP-N-acetylneuraminic acid synthetase
MKFNNLAIIPARANSKRVPGKNMKELNGVPVYWHTLVAALRTPEIDCLIFTSESNRILKDAKKRVLKHYKLGSTGFLNRNKIWADGKTIYLHKRGEELSQDFVQVSEVALNAFRHFQLSGKTVKNIIVLQPTSPFRDWKIIQKAILTFGDIYAREGTLFTAYKDNGFHWRVDDDGCVPLGHNPERRFGGQDEYSNYSIARENGSLYILSAETFSLHTVMRVPPFHALIVDDTIDIDTYEDFEKAEEKFK